jgi:hypothetical protein
MFAGDPVRRRKGFSAIRTGFIVEEFDIRVGKSAVAEIGTND